MNEQNGLNRRQFLSTVTSAAAVLALGLTPAASAAKIFSFGKNAKRVGISDAAYKKAWKRAQKLVAQMTLEEKICQLGAGKHFGAGSDAIPRLGLPRYEYASGEALHGLHLSISVTSTSFPVPLAMAASWDPELAVRIYSAVSDEARAYDNRLKIGLSYYSPVTLNLHRDPRWGRCEEAPGEDPCLAATIGAQMVRGMQGDNWRYLKTTACAKHFLGNNTEDDRTKVCAPVDARSFWEYYSRAYSAMILEGDVFTVMGAYSGINGVPCCADQFLLTDLLRHRWGFRGYVTSDCDAVYNIYNPHHYAANLPIASAMAVLAGCDVDCGGTLQRHLMAAVKRELISENDIGLAVTRLLTVRHLLGLFDPPEKVPYTQIPFKVVDCPAHRALALEAARQSLVLLKNDSQFLPLDKGNLKKIAVIGPLAGTCNLGGYSGIPAVHVSPFQGIAEYLGIKNYRPFILAADSADRSDTCITETSGGREIYLSFTADGAWAEYAKADFTGKTEFKARMSASANGGRIEVRLDQLDGPLACALTAPLPVKGQKFFNTSTPLSGIHGEHSIFLVFHGHGETPLNLAQFQLNPISPSPAQPGCPQIVYQPGCGIIESKDEVMFNEAVEAARDADVVILVCGITAEVCREGYDRDTIGLTGTQPELIQAVFAANPKTVLVLSSNNSVAVSWEQDHLPAILGAICAGQAQGTAIAQALFGDYNPGGKLPCTWYRWLSDLPDFHDYDLHKGRTYMYFEKDPLYPFGHGLSYTTFTLDQFKVGSATLGPDETVKVSVAVANTGKVAGAEVVQLYLVPPPSPVKRPIKQLAGFQRVELEPGQSKMVVFELPFTAQPFWYWDDAQRKFVLQPGTAKILIGNSSANILQTGELTLKAATEVLSEPDAVDTIAAKSTVV